MSAKLSNSPARPLLANRVTETAAWNGVECRVSREDISDGVDWAIREPRHAVIVHLEGAINQLETEFEGRGAALDPPMAGEVWLIPAGRQYASAARGGIVRYAELYFDPSCLTELCGRQIAAEELLPQTGHFDDFLHHSVRYLAGLIPHTDDVSQMMARTLGQALCLHLLREYGDGRKGRISHARAQGLATQTAKLLQEYVDANLGERITLDELAGLARMSSHHLLCSFRQTFGTTPAQYVLDQRLRRARWLLSTTTKDITTISVETGFASHSHFATTFKARTGFTPREFRQLRAKR